MRKLLPFAGAALLLAAGAPALAPVRADAETRLDQLLDRADADHDGALSRQELTAFRAAEFDRLDRNRDGVVTRDELPRMARRLAVRRMQTSGGLGLDSPGGVTRQAFMARTDAVFDRLDADHDGRVTRGEVAAARAAWRAR
jgi:Ca2+-binding EF-hand superfamily protein